MNTRVVLTPTLLFLLLLLFAGCSQKQWNMTQYPLSVNEKQAIPKICQPYYKNQLPTIAVMDFTNNSMFGRANVEHTNTSKKVGALGGVIINSDGIGLGGTAKAEQSSVNVKREVDAKLSQTLTPLLETKMSRLSGITLVARNDIEKINKELQLQDSGLLDESTTVQAGKLLDAKYIVTGSIDNVEINQRNHESAAIAVDSVTSRTEHVGVQVAGLLGRVWTSFTDGILLKTTISIKILEVQTGEILHAQTIQEEINIGKFSNPTYDVYIGGIKAAIINSLENINYEFSNNFSVSGYITKIKTDGSDAIVQVNVGTKHKIKPQDRFNVYMFEESIDPLTKQQTCDKILLPIQLEATTMVGSFTSWLHTTKQQAPLKLLYYVEKDTSKESLFDLPTF